MNFAFPRRCERNANVVDSSFNDKGRYLSQKGRCPDFQDETKVGQPIKRCRGRLGVAEHARPLAAAQDCCDHDVGVVIKTGMQTEAPPSF